MLGILSSFVLKNPKMAIAAGVAFAVFLFFVHYKMLVSERDKLRIAEAGYKVAVAAFIRREETMREDIRLATEATALVTAERNSQISALNALRAGRQIDQEARTWGEQALPISEIVRLCEALPEMVGCQDTTPSN